MLGVIENVVMSNFGAGIALPDAIPKVLPLEDNPIIKTTTFGDLGKQQLDGLDCRDCKFNNAGLVYGGGSWNLKNPTLSGTTTVSLVGAAANTLALLKFLSSIGKGVPGISFPQNAPIKQKAVAKKPFTTMQVTAPYIGLK